MTLTQKEGYSLRDMGRKRIRTLRDFRRDHHLTQVDAAKQFGVAQTVWSAWERGASRPRKELAKRLLRETGVPLEVLMGITE